MQDYGSEMTVRPDIDCNIGEFCKSKGINECLGHPGLPHFVRSAFVGPAMAREMVDMFFDILPTTVPYPGVDNSMVERVSGYLCEDRLKVGVIPADVLREFYLAHSMGERAEKLEEGKKVADMLLSIKKKQGFKREIKLWQEKLRLNLWPTVFDTLRPVLEEFEREGGQVRIFVQYSSMEQRDLRVDMELNDAIKHPGQGWREDTIKFF